jgi:hypothetical protein
LTEKLPEKIDSPFERVKSEPVQRAKPNTFFLQIASGVLAISGVFALATWIDIPEIEFGAGVGDLPSCVRDSVVNFDLQVQTTGTTIRALDITGLNTDCNGKFLRVSLTSSTDSVLRQMTSARLTTATTLRLTPATPALDPDVVRGINLEVSDSAF